MEPIQKSIYNRLKEQSSDNFKKLTGIFNYMDKNTNFPFIFIALNGIENLSTFSKQIHSYSVSINIYDMNTTGNFVNGMAEEIVETFSDISKISVEGHRITDIRSTDTKISLETNNTIWRCELMYNFIVEKI